MNGAPKLEGADVLEPMEPAALRIRLDRNPRRTGNRFAVLNAFVDYSLARVLRTDAAVWLVLYRDTQRDGMARTGQADIARRAGISTRTVKRAIKRLEGAGLLRVVRRGGLNRGPSAYHVRGIPDE